MKLRDAVLFDVDGTVAERVNRGPYDWELVGEDVPRIPVIRGIRAMVKYEDAVSIAISGRMDSGTCRMQTTMWLNEHMGFRYDWLFMRENYDFRPDNEVKSDIYLTKIKPFYNVIAVWDDRDQVVRMWRDEHQLHCFQVADGNF